ncbi:MAG: xanthine dehydrogenase family protein molybdopterin-binding subunit [Defluviicoccus sp.]|nr:xanthine dehydrogenase family protein molybdopterin-binding subunit [Defluviicoccus sp.]
MPEGGIGASVKRKEDFRFLTGRGSYTDDQVRAGQLYAHMLRSPHGHAELASVDTSAAEAAPGVVCVLTGPDADADGIGGLPCGWGITSKDGNPMIEPKWPVIGQGKVRYVGEIVAAVIAESAEQAADAAELVEIDYRPLDAAAVTETAHLDGAAQIHDEAPDNLCFDWDFPGQEAADAVDAAFQAAAHTARLELVNQRIIPHSMEPRAAVAEYDKGEEKLTLYCTAQAAHAMRLLLGAFVLNQPEHKFRVVAPDVGGGFGSKVAPYAEYAIICWASRRLERPVRWLGERAECFVTDAHGRDHVTEVELALDGDGKFTGLRVNTIANMGAYLSAFAPLIPTFLYATLFAGQYTTPAICCNVKAVFTNTSPVDALRGAGRPEATYLLERVIDEASRVTGIDPVEIRRRNFIAADAFPYQTPVALLYDSGAYERALDIALEKSDWNGFGARRSASEADGKLRGIGVAAPIEATGAAPSAIAGQLGARAGLYESAQVRFNATGTVTVFSGGHNHGQGHETTFAQLVTDKLGVPLENVEIVEGDTDRAVMGMGTYGSRSLSVGGSAIDRAMDKIIDKGKKIASHLLEASVDDIEFDSGTFTVSGTDRTVSIGEVAFAAYVPHNYPLEELEPGLDEQAFFDPVNFNFPFASYVCEVEIDPETGSVSVERFTAVDDVGNIVNPMIVEGQVHGGLAHGIGQALMEGAVFDEAGQPLTGSLMDYTLPRADTVPSFDLDHTVTPCPMNPLGVKGVGEIGAIGAPAAVVNAIVNALLPLGINHVDMPVTSQSVWQAIQSAKAS